MHIEITVDGVTHIGKQEKSEDDLDYMIDVIKSLLVTGAACVEFGLEGGNTLILPKEKINDVVMLFVRTPIK